MRIVVADQAAESMLASAYSSLQERNKLIAGFFWPDGGLLDEGNV
jgi:hypothetical protein